MPGVLEIEEREAPAAASVEPSRLLARKLAALRSRHIGVAVLTGLAIAISVAIELLALELFADWWLDFHWSVRLVLLLLQLGALAYILVRLVAGPLFWRPGGGGRALVGEKARAPFRSRLLSPL